MYKLKIIKDKNTWNSFVENNNFDFYSFLCSWEWWEFQIMSWKEVLRYWIYKNDVLVWLIPLILNKARRATYLFAPHTPLIINTIDFFEVIKFIKKDLINISKNNKADFLRFNSPVKNTKNNKEKFKELWFINSPMHEHAEDTHLLDLKQSEEDILSNIKKWDRYYINRAIKEGVVINNENSKYNIETLKKMHLEHSKKIWYHPFKEEFIDNLYESFWDNINTISASYNWKIESILMTIKFWKTCVYYIAASDIINHKFSPNYLCQWEAIKNAKKNWCEIYNFWGVSPDDNPKHPIAGVTKFKRKFSWYDYSLLHAQDLIITKKYYFNYIVETIRRIKRWYYYKKPE